MRLFFILLMMLFSFTGTGQTEFAPVGAKWLYEKVFYSFDGEEESKSHIIINSLSDTLVKGLNCKEISVKEILQEGTTFEETCFLCQKDDSIFRVDEDKMELLFDFSREKNDTLFIDTFRFLFYIIDSTYTDTIQSEVLKKQNISLFCSNITSPINKMEILEKVGPIASILEPSVDLSFYLLFPDYECLLDVVPIIKFICYSDDLIMYNPNNSTICDSLLTSDRNIISNLKSFKVYPNPSIGNITIESNFSSYQKIKLRIIDLSGKLLVEEAIDFNGIHQLNIEYLPVGIYFIILKDQNGFLIQGQKLIKL